MKERSAVGIVLMITGIAWIPLSEPHGLINILSIVGCLAAMAVGAYLTYTGRSSDSESSP
jgi:hypothetical protein